MVLKGLSMVNLRFWCMARACYLDGRERSTLYTKPSSPPEQDKRKRGGQLVDPENQLSKARVMSLLGGL